MARDGKITFPTKKVSETQKFPKPTVGLFAKLATPPIAAYPECHFPPQPQCFSSAFTGEPRGRPTPPC